jgi:GT2 family glycosyltransferase
MYRIILWQKVKGTMAKVTCIIPTNFSKKTFPYLTACLKSLQRSINASKKVQVHVILVTETAGVKKKIHPLVKEIYIADKGSGFAGMNNLAIELSRKKYNSDYYLFLNDDTKVAADFFSQFLQMILTEDADFIIPFISQGKKSAIDSFGVEYFTSGYAKNALSAEIPTTLASASCLFVQTAFLDKLKKKFRFYFNPILFYYLEDVEFSIRAFNIGGKLMKNARLKVQHYGSTTSGKKSHFTMFQTYRNIIWVIILTWPMNVILRNIVNIFLVQVWTIFYSTKSFGPQMYLRILLETFQNFATLTTYRRKTIAQYSKKVSFSSLFSLYAFRTYHDFKIPSI